MFIVGVDLSGPSNAADTVMCTFECGEGGLKRGEVLCGVTDEELIEAFGAMQRRGDVVAGLDAPLSYQPGGGSRASDQALRKRTIAAGLHPGSVMSPTFNRMAYLTLRGISVARALQWPATGKLRLVEVHPGAALALDGAPIDAVKSFKRDAAARTVILKWLEGQGLPEVASIEDPSDHYVAACAAALAAWKWSRGESAWLHPAEPPLHPFDFAV